MKKQAMVLCGVLTMALMIISGCGLLDDADLIHEGGEISGNEVWDSGNHLVTGDITVTGSLTISACATIKVEDSITFQVSDGGSVKSLGTANCPVTFTSAKAVPAAGDWNRIDIYDSASNDNVFTYTKFRYAGDNYGVLWVDNDASVSVDHCSFSHIKEHAVTIKSGADVGSFSGNSFSYVGGHLLEVAANVMQLLSPIESANNSNAYIQIGDGTTAETGIWQNPGVPVHAADLYFNAPVTINAGFTLLLEHAGSIDVSDGGSLRTMGSDLEHVTISSAKAAPAAGDWNEIDIYDSASNDNEFHYTDIIYGGGSGSYGALWVDDGMTVVLDHVVFRDNEECDISGDGTVTATASPYGFCN